MSSTPSSPPRARGLHLAWRISVVVTVLLGGRAFAAPTQLVDENPTRISTVAPGVHLVDFGRVAFGNLRLTPPAGADARVVVHFGEAMTQGRINRKPPGTVRYALTEARLSGGQPIVAAPPPDERNTRQPQGMNEAQRRAANFDPQAPPAILTPAEWGVILPFRWVEIEGWPGELRPEHLRRQAAYASTWDDTAAAFESSDSTLNRIWELCRYSIKATTLAGVYVDGDRERIPYEADSYLNQLSHYATDHDVQMARDTYDYMMRFPTWPTEWASHMVFMAHADWWHTGDTAWVGARFEALKSKLLLERLGPDGLILSTAAHIKKGDLVDWPAGERDGFVFTPVNAVSNAFFIRALVLMSELATALGRTAEAAEYGERARVAKEAFHRLLFHPETGLYRDGVGTDHSSMHTNLFATAFGLVPPEHAERLKAWLAGRTMDCSVYVAQYFMEALFRQGSAGRAIDLMLAPGDRSWRHMVESGTTITWEAWDQKYKPNQDWNHAWGAAPANLLPRFILGVEAAKPGWTHASIAPQTGGLSSASGRVPTPRGPIDVAWTDGAVFSLRLSLPPGVSAHLTLPAAAASNTVLINGQPVAARREGSRWQVDGTWTGSLTVEVR